MKITRESIKSAIFVLIIGIAFVVIAILTIKLNKKNTLSEDRDKTESVSENEVSAGTESYYSDKDIRDLEKQIENLEEENAELRGKLYITDAGKEEESAIYDAIKKDLVLSFQLYNNLVCNGGYRFKYLYLQHTELVNHRLTSVGAKCFFSEESLTNMQNKFGKYDINDVQEMKYEFNDYIDCIDILVSDVDVEEMTANYAAVYRLYRTAVAQNQTDTTGWVIVYGKVIYNAKEDIWQADDIYALRDFTTDPDNMDVLFKQSESWLKDSGYWEFLEQNGNGK